MVTGSNIFNELFWIKIAGRRAGEGEGDGNHSTQMKCSSCSEFRSTFEYWCEDFTQWPLFKIRFNFFLLLTSEDLTLIQYVFLIAWGSLELSSREPTNKQQTNIFTIFRQVLYLNLFYILGNQMSSMLFLLLHLMPLPISFLSVT